MKMWKKRAVAALPVLILAALFACAAAYGPQFQRPGGGKGPERSQEEFLIQTQQDKLAELEEKEGLYSQDVIILADTDKKTGKENCESADAGGISERESAEDGVKGSFPEHAAPDSDGSHFQFQGKRIGTQHIGRGLGSGAKTE